MIIDGRDVPHDHELETDICIIGAGAAGISIAREFLASPYRVALIESGGFEYEDQTQALYEGRVVGQAYKALDAVRLRYFGGTTNHWAGYSRPFMSADFHHFEWIPNSGWPIGKSDLDPYYEKAFGVCQFGRGLWRWDTDFWHDLVGEGGEAFAQSIFGTLVFQIAPLLENFARSFGLYYRGELQDSLNISVYLNSNVVSLDGGASGRVIQKAEVACLTGTRFDIAARYFILAAGGLENPRLLLASPGPGEKGLGNQFDMVGRYFMDHFHFPVANLVVTDPDRFPDLLIGSVETPAGTIAGVLDLSPERRAQERIGSVLVGFEPVSDARYYSAAQSEGVASVRKLRDTLADARIPRDLLEHIRNIIVDLDDIALTVYRKTVFDRMPYSHLLVHASVEPTPNPESRVTLIEDRDRLGVRRVQLDWRLSDLDKASVERTMELLALEVGRLELGRLQIVWNRSSDWPQDLEIGYHLIGTTRMSAAPQAGVVDVNCRVHNTKNLFIAGSSVFSTAGYTTPTMTLVALALRLADHIKEQIQ